MAATFVSLNAICQVGQIVSHILKRDSTADNSNLVILLKHGDSTINTTVPDSNGQFTFKDLYRGFYNLIVQKFGFKDFLEDSLLIVSGAPVDINFTYPPPCKFVYVEGKEPKCIGGHTNGIIPIVYGLPTRKTLIKQKRVWCISVAVL